MAPAVPVPMIVPSGARTVTVAPASAWPLTMVPVVSTLAVSPIGAVVSSAVSASGGETLPAASAWTTDRAWPLSCALAKATEKLPSAATVAVPRGCPLTSRTVTVAPGSPVPFTSVPSAEMVPTGASGAVRSGAATVAGVETLPAASPCVTCNVSPSIWAGVSDAA